MAYLNTIDVLQEVKEHLKLSPTDDVLRPEMFNDYLDKLKGTDKKEESVHIKAQEIALSQRRQQLDRREAEVKNLESEVKKREEKVAVREKKIKKIWDEILRQKDIDKEVQAMIDKFVEEYEYEGSSPEEEDLFG